MALARFLPKKLFQVFLYQVFSAPYKADFAGLDPQHIKADENFLVDFWEKNRVRTVRAGTALLVSD